MEVRTGVGSLRALVMGEIIDLTFAVRRKAEASHLEHKRPSRPMTSNLPGLGWNECRPRKSTSRSFWLAKSEQLWSRFCAAPARPDHHAPRQGAMVRPRM